jgi:AcrR family transcriptional regulator
MKAGNQSSKSGKSSRNERSPASGREPAAGRARPGAREKILAAALELFSVNGFDEALWKAVVDGVHEGLRTSLAATGAGVESPAQVASAIRSAVYFAAKNPAFVRLMNDEGKRKSARMRWLVDRHGKPMFDALAGFFSEARERGFVPDAEPLHLYYMFLGAVGLIFSQAPECKRLTGTDPTVDEAVIEAHADAVVALFVRNPTMGTRG